MQLAYQKSTINIGRNALSNEVPLTSKTRAPIPKLLAQNKMPAPGWRRRTSLPPKIGFLESVVWHAHQVKSLDELQHYALPQGREALSDLQDVGA
jgi:hypothetical protein